MIRAVSVIVSLAILVGSIAYVVKDFATEHVGHGHSLSDPGHLIGLGVAVIGAAGTWASVFWRRRGS